MFPQSYYRNLFHVISRTQIQLLICFGWIHFSCFYFNFVLILYCVCILCVSVVHQHMYVFASYIHICLYLCICEYRNVQFCVKITLWSKVIFLVDGCLALANILCWRNKDPGIFVAIPKIRDFKVFGKNFWLFGKKCGISLALLRHVNFVLLFAGPD